MTLCEKLTQARKAAGLTQADIAARLSVSRQAVSRWESGQSKPSTEKLLALTIINGYSGKEGLQEAADYMLELLKEFAASKDEELIYF